MPKEDEVKIELLLPARTGWSGGKIADVNGLFVRIDDGDPRGALQLTLQTIVEGYLQYVPGARG